MSKSANPDYPDADPTAPGGMSQKALIAELVERHGWKKSEAKAMKWPEQITAVIEGRLAREREAEQVEQVDVDEADLILAEMEEGQAEMKRNSLLITDPDTYDFIFNGHAGAGPSGAERWMNCTKSLRLSREFLETLTPNQQVEFSKASVAARQGTTAHAAGEAELNLILGRITAEERDATLLELAIMPDDGEEYDDDMAEHVSLYVDLVNQFIEERGEEHVLIESRLEAAVWLTGDHSEEYHVINGSGDTVVLPTKTDPTLVVIDYKHGEGVDVEVDDNPQVRIYGLGALSLLTNDEGELITDVEEVVYYIVQPRNGGIKEWRESLDDLLTWRDDVLAPALTAALFDDASAPAEFQPSDAACQFCPARGTCPALTQQRMDQASELFDVIVDAEFEDGPGAFPETSSLDNDKLGRLMEQIDGLVKIREAMRDEVQRRLHRGQSVPGYKLVNYTPARKWTEDAAESLVYTHPALFAQKMVTPKQALTLLKTEGEAADVLEPFIEVFDPRPVVAPEGDRRKTWMGKAPEDMFSNLDD